jgi:hypothetical protein
VSTTQIRLTPGGGGAQFANLYTRRFE